MKSLVQNAFPTFFLLLLATLTFANDIVLTTLQSELARSQKNLGHASAKAPMYYLQYTVYDKTTFGLSCIDGGMTEPRSGHARSFCVDLRVGSKALDNTHELRGSDNFRDNYEQSRDQAFPLEDDTLAMKIALWNETEYRYQKGKERFTKVLTNKQVKVNEEDRSDDFSDATPQQYEEPSSVVAFDTTKWRDLVKRAGVRLASMPFANSANVTLNITNRTQYIVNTDGSQIRQTQHYIVLSMQVSGMADDGMDLLRMEQFTCSDPSGLPTEETVFATADRILSELKALKSAPIVDPYIGPAILSNRASGVFFHEIFGHRIEGHRQKNTNEGQTFTKKVNELILPKFISVYDDPTQRKLGATDLRGYYKYDDEGVLSHRVTIVEHGILRNFLTSRSPLKDFPLGNAHGRREEGYPIVSRQGNLMMIPDTSVTYTRLREMLIEECKKQNKPYGLVFNDISGGFTMTRRQGPQAFKVLPLLVYRVYADGRPDEIVRGVDIVGTPLTSFSKIIMAGNDPDVFNGTCGAESGWVPVSASSPSILVSEIEVEKRQKGQEKPPILPPPSTGNGETRIP